MAIESKHIFSRNPRIAFRRIAEVMVLVDVSENILLKLNATGAFIWEHGDGMPLESIARRIAEQFDVDVVRAQTDVLEFVEVLVQRKLATVAGGGEE
ncbi:MAG: PqqD family protein [Deltaproteobacteria bacterium]|nr:PqqD family protein [Deltaproteobacteria bacterium]